MSWKQLFQSFRNRILATVLFCPEFEAGPFPTRRKVFISRRQTRGWRRASRSTSPWRSSRLSILASSPCFVPFPIAILAPGSVVFSGFFLTVAASMQKLMDLANS
jgi:hypothetical protein